MAAAESDTFQPPLCPLPETMSGVTPGVRDPEILPFVTHLPIYALEAAAGKFGKQQIDTDPEDWLEVPPNHLPITKDMFLTHIKGCSMEPTIPDGSLCAFTRNVSAPYDGKVLLMEEYGEAGGNRYAVKRYRTSRNTDPNDESDQAWLHERITLESINPDYADWDVASAQKVIVIGQFVHHATTEWPLKVLCVARIESVTRNGCLVPSISLQCWGG